MRKDKFKNQTWGLILTFLVTVLFNSAIADDPAVTGQTSQVDESPLVASILQKHISDLNNQSTIKLNQGDKEKVVFVAMCFNYLIVLMIASLIVFRTRAVRPRLKQVFRLRH